jgi:hypothetical protein
MGVDAILIRIRTQAAERAIRVTDHAREEMEEESITLAEVLEAIANGQILDNYPDHKRGSCCLLYGLSARWRPLHVVCTTSLPRLVIITAYVPVPPKWIGPTERRFK